MRWPSLLSAVLVLVAGAVLPTVEAQEEDSDAPPAFAAGANKVYCQAAADQLSVWMNTAEPTGTVPYYLTGEPEPNSGMDPVADEPFTARIALTPALGQDLVLDGTINVQAYIGGGSFTVAQASIETSLVVAGTAVATAAAKDHTMQPSGEGATYTPISWTMTVANVAVPAGALVEWVISGTVQAGNNVFLACYEARGMSYIELPVKSASAGASGLGPVVENVATAVFERTFSPTVATSSSHLYNWPGFTSARIAYDGDVGNGSLHFVITDSAATQLVNATLAAAANRTLNVTAAPGNWSIAITLTGFQGNFTLMIDAPPSADNSTATGTGTSTGTSDGDSAPGDGEKGSPGAGLLGSLVALGVVVAVLRRRR